MNTENPTDRAATGLSIDTQNLRNAEDILYEAQDFANLISMAHRRSRLDDPDGASISASVLHVCYLIQKAKDLMQAFRDEVHNGR